MNKIASFTVNHLYLLTGVYVSRKDYIGDVAVLSEIAVHILLQS